MLVSKRISRNEFLRACNQCEVVNLSANCAVQISPFSIYDKAAKDVANILPNKNFYGDTTNTGLVNETKTTIKRKNTLKDGTKFGCQARARFSRNLSAYAMNFTGNFGFLTLTFPPTAYDYAYDAELLDNVLTGAVQRFFKRLRRERLINEFAWVAERHTENAEKHEIITQAHKDFLHYHCFVFFPSFIDVQKLNKIWLEILSNVDFLQCRLQNENGDNYNPVDCDFHPNANEISYILTYTKKYCSKDCETGKIYSRRWGWSRGLSSVLGVVKIEPCEIEQLVDDITILDEDKYTTFYEVTSFGKIKEALRDEKSGEIIRDNDGNELTQYLTTGDGKPILTAKFKFYTCRLPFAIGNLEVFQKHFIKLKSLKHVCKNH